jgi:hypothetical protein
MPDVDLVASTLAQGPPRVAPIAMPGYARELSPTELRHLSLALVLAGPVATLTAIATRFVAPYLTGPVLVAGLTAILLVGRAVTG